VQAKVHVRLGVPRQVVVVAAVLALLLALLALLTAVAGTSQFGDARTGGLIDGPLIRLEPPQAGDRAERVTQEQASARPPRWLPALLALPVALVLALAVRALMRSGGGAAQEQDPAPPLGDAEGDPHALVLDELRAGARAAAAQVRHDAAGTADAVVRCWERLEEHGERLGTPRAAHETPTEFGSDLLRRHGADPAAVDDLLHLYHRARFGSRPLEEGAAERAAADLDRIRAGLAARRPGAGR
jgi:hypothetical protein